MKILKTVSLGSNFAGSYKKECTSNIKFSDCLFGQKSPTKSKFILHFMPINSLSRARFSLQLHCLRHVQWRSLSHSYDCIEAYNGGDLVTVMVVLSTFLFKIILPYNAQ